MGEMKHSMNGFTLADIDHGDVLMVNMLTKTGAAIFDAGLDVKGRHFQAKLGTKEFDDTSARIEIKARAVSISRKVAMQVSKDGVKVNFDRDVFQLLMRQIFHSNLDGSAGRKHGRLLPL